MSSFFSSLFGGSKSKKPKRNATPPKNEKTTETPPSPEDDGDIPVFSRRISLSKSGRMKEHKRRTVPVSEFPTEKSRNKKAEDEVSCDLPDSEIFDTHGIIEEIKSSLEKEKN